MSEFLENLYWEQGWLVVGGREAGCESLSVQGSFLLGSSSISGLFPSSLLPAACGVPASPPGAQKTDLLE